MVRSGWQDSAKSLVRMHQRRVLRRPWAVSCRPHTSEVCTINTSGFDFR